MTATPKSRYRFTIAMIESAFIQTGKSLEQMIRICRESGFAGFEGWLPPFESLGEKELERAGRQIREAGLVIDTFHLPHKDRAMNDIANLYEGDRVKVEETMKRWIDRAAAVGATIGILHPTTRNEYAVGVEGPDRLMAALGRTLEALLKHCEQYRFRLAVENMLPAGGDRLGCRVEHLERILREHDHPLLGFCLDTGHALVSHGRRAMEVFRFMKDRLIAFHLDDNAGDRDSHLAPGHGLFPWSELFRELNGMDFPHTVCVEAPPFSYGPDYPVEAWQEMYAGVTALASAE